MKKSEIYRAIIAAVIGSEMEFDEMFEALDECFSEYRYAISCEKTKEGE